MPTGNTFTVSFDRLTNSQIGFLHFNNRFAVCQYKSESVDFDLVWNSETDRMRGISYLYVIFTLRINR